MSNLLIYEKDIHNCKKIVNLISNMNFDIKIYSIVTEVFEIEQIIKKSKVDLIILDCLNEDHPDINFITQFITVTDFNIPIIVLTNSSRICQTFIEKNIIAIDNFDLLCSSIDFLLLNSPTNTLKSVIAKELDYLCFNPNHVGTQYLIDVISLIYQEYSFINNLTKFVYPKISKKYAISINTLKCDIFQSTLHSYINCEEIKLKNYLNNSCIEKPSAKSYINSIIHHIKLGTLRK